MTGQSELEDFWPLSPLQEGLLFHALFDEDALDVYTVQAVLDLEGSLDAAWLRSAAQALLDRHSCLRTAIFLLNDPPVQVVVREVQVPWTEVDLSGWPTEDRSSRCDRLVENDRITRFDLQDPPLLRFLLVKIGEERYRLILSVHHILLDAWSMSLAMGELFALYASGGDGSQLPRVRSFRDYLVWLSTRDRSAALAEWAQALKGVAAPTLLAAADRSRPPVVLPEQVDLDISADLTPRLTSFARARGLTLNTLVQVAWAVVLSRSVGRLDVVFGTTVAGRPAELPGVESMLGLFINTIPVRVRIDPAESLVDLLRRIQDEQFRLLDYQYVGLAELQREVGVDALFDTITVFESFPFDIVGMARLLDSTAATFTGIAVRDSTHYPMALMAIPGTRLQIALKYRPDLFDSVAVQVLADRVVRVLELMVTEPELRISAVDVLSARERNQLLVEWNDTSAEVERTTLFELFTAQVGRTPDAVAVVCGKESVTYAELDQRAGRLADHLITCGAGPERVVGVCLDRSVELVVALVGVLRTGAAFVPLEPGWPAVRIEQVCRSADTVAVVTSVATGVASDVMQVNIENLPESSGSEPGGSAGPVDPESVAYVIFTSGSTGTPKGVMIRHCAIAARFLWQRELLDFGVGDAVLFKAPLAFDISINEVFLPLVSGARLVVAEPGGERDVEYLLELIERERVTFVYLVSSMLDLLLELPGVAVRARVLRHVWCGGEALSPGLFDRFRASLGAVMYHGYGPAEATIGVTHQFYRPGQSRAGVTIGGPNPNTRIYLLDEGLCPVPVGVTGELYAGGLPLGRGYVNDPAQTASRFVADLFSAGERLYRTGDLARWRPDGILEFCGRADTQIKIRGMRVEPGEIEAVLTRHPQIAQAAVIVRDDPSGRGSARLIGYVVPKEPTEQDQGRRAALSQPLWEELKRQLPEYMVPAALVMLDRLPLTANGKLDVTALPDPEPAARLTTGRAPVSAQEQLLCELFADVLGLPEVGVDDDFFAVGGDSIIAMQLVNRARSRHLSISPREVFQHRTPAALAGLVAGKEPIVAPVSDSDGVGSLPLLPIVQRRSEQSGPSKRYNQYILVQVPAAADWAALDRILQAVLDRHDGLRQRLTRHAPGSWSLETTAVGSVRAADLLRRVDTAGLDTAAVRAVIAVESDAATARLDPDAGVMLQAVWFDAGRTEQGRLLVLAHHLVIDGVSWRILLEDFVAGWAAVRAGKPPEPAGVGTSLRSFARMLVEQAQQPSRLAELQHWVQTLSPGGDLVPGAVSAATVSATRHHDIRLPVSDTVPLLTSVPATARAEVTDVLVAALRVAVSRWHERHGRDGSADLLVDLERHGREEIIPGVDLSRTVGWFTSIAPVRLPASPDVLTVLEVVTERLRAMPDGGVSYGMLRYANPRTAPVLAGTSRPQVLFNYLGRFDIGQPGEWTRAPESDAVVADPDAEMGVSHPLAVNAICTDTPEGPQLQAIFTYVTTVLSAEDADELADAWAAALRELVVRPAAGDDRDTLVQSWPDPLPPLIGHCGDNILLTGASGFFGAFLLRELLIQYRGTVHCLVRAESTTHAWDKLRANLRRYGLSAEVLFQNRIRVVVGDLSRPRLDLATDVYGYLADNIDLIIHSGAHVDMLHSYETLEAVNVGGTRELLRFAGTTWRKPLRLISTVRAAECDPSVSSNVPGYVESKWRAEQVVAEARAHGIPAAVYRVPRISGDSVTGRSNDRDFIVRLARCSLDLGIAPHVLFAEDWIPVDEAARLLVSPYPGPEHGACFALTSPRLVCLSEIVELAREIGHEVEDMPVSEWCRDVASGSVEEYQVLALTLGIYSAVSALDEDISPPPDEAPPGGSIPIVAHGVTDQVLLRYLHAISPARRMD
ncbi:MAG: amino acid adenylation domain-containing protein [Pseudonocardiaceae bacterium]